MSAGLHRLNSLAAPEAEARLLTCCGSHLWAQRMAGARPFRTLDELYETADRIWWELDRENWLEAFSAHPRIGETTAARATGAQASQWSKQEQAGARQASAETLNALREGNQAYEKRFGYLFIVCATGKSTQEMLANLRRRLQNDPETELRTAAEEQRRITRLRLEKLVSA